MRTPEVAGCRLAEVGPLASTSWRRFALLAMVVVVASGIAACSAAGPTSPGAPGGGGGGDGSGGGGGGGGSGGGASGSFEAPDTYALDHTGTLSARGWIADGFTLDRPATVVLRLVSDNAIQGGIIAPDQLQAFENYAGVSGYSLFDKTFGTAYVSLPAGSFYIAVRDAANTDNPYRYELDLNIADVLPKSSSATFSFTDIYVQGSKYVTARGGRLWQPFTIAQGYRYFLDGVNIGLTTDIIPAKDLGSFQAGGSYNYYEDYHSDTEEGPGLFELRLPPGDYAFVASNLDEVAHPLTYTMERWRVIGGTTGDLALTDSAPSVLLSKPTPAGTATSAVGAPP